MWINGERFRTARDFCPQAGVKTWEVFNRPCEKIFCPPFFHKFSFHIQQGLWITFEVGKKPGRATAYLYECILNKEYSKGVFVLRTVRHRQALMLAVMV